MQSSPWRTPPSLPRQMVYALAVVVLIVLTNTVAQASNAHPELPRFQQVTEHLFRGAQPRRGGLELLAKLGINTVVNLRGTDSRTLGDETHARLLGLKYFNVPLPVWGRPNDAEVRRLLEIIAAPENGKVFIHCKDGVDRTGMVVALHRITREGWLPRAATEEATSHGMRRYQYWMRDYINDYYVRWQREGSQNALLANGDGGNFKDRIGRRVRHGERAVRTVSGFLGRVF